MFYGIIISMFYMDKEKHHKPHIHVKYGDQDAIIEIPNGELLEGQIKSEKMKLIQAWIEIHKEELMANWDLAIKGENVYKIEPLK